LASLGCLYAGVTVVPIYDTLGEEATQFAFDQTEMEVCFVTAKHLDKIIQVKKNGQAYKSLKTLVILDYWEIDSTTLLEKRETLNIFSLEKLISEGEKNPLALKDIPSNSVYCLCYTSGTTGTPKGALIGSSQLAQVLGNFEERQVLYNDDIYISYLPLAHVMEVVVFQSILFNKGKIGFFHGDMFKLKEDFQILKPTILLTVPRILNRMCDGIKKQFEEQCFAKKWLIDKAVQTKLDNLKTTGELHSWFYDKLIFSKTREALGGNVRIMAVGSAPIQKETIDFLKICFQIPIINGYG
jgi:long-chain acyl-CoA synthetase